MVKRFCFLAVVASILMLQQSLYAERGELWQKENADGIIKVYINEPVNESGQGQIIPDQFKKSLEAAILSRKSMKFEIVKSLAESEVQIASVIKKFQYMEKGPLKPTPGIGTTLLDAAATMTDNYAEMSVDFVVTDSKTGAVMWKNNLFPYMKKKMAPEESIAVICDRVASNFMWKCFGKPNNN